MNHWRKEPYQSVEEFLTPPPAVDDLDDADEAAITAWGDAVLAAKREGRPVPPPPMLGPHRRGAEEGA